MSYLLNMDIKFLLLSIDGAGIEFMLKFLSLKNGAPWMHTYLTKILYQINKRNQKKTAKP